MDSESGSRRTQVGQYNSETGASYGENEVVFTEGDVVKAVWCNARLGSWLVGGVFQ